jgi:lysophospholipase
MSIELADHIEIPVLLLQAQEDKVVNLEPQEEFCKRAKMCKGVKIEDAYHEMLIEKDIVRNKALSAILDFISKI